MKKYIKLITGIVITLNYSLLLASPDKHNEKEHVGTISYDYFDIAYLDVETHEEDGDGYLLRGVKSLNEMLYLTTEYGNTNLSHGDFKLFRLGIGIHKSFSSSIDGIAELTYEELDLNEHHHHFKDDGYGIAVGIRALFNENLEGTFKARHIDFGHENDLILSAELLYLFNHNFGFVGSYEDGNEKIWSFGVRFQF